MTKGAQYLQRLLWLAIMMMVGCAGPTQYAGGPIVLPAIDPLTKYQDFPLVRIEVASLQPLANDGVAIVLRYVNKTQRDLLITLRKRCAPGWGDHGAEVIDDAGNQYPCRRFIGLSQREGLSLPAGGQATATYLFDPPKQMLNKGTRFSFSSAQELHAPIARGAARKIAQYSITLSDIEPRQKAGSAGVTSTQTPPSQGQGSKDPSAQYQDFPLVRIEVASLQPLANDGVAIVLRYVNKTQRDLLITLRKRCAPGWGDHGAEVIDDAGNQYPCRRFIGLSQREGLSLPAGGQATATYLFDPPKQMLNKGTRFSFSSAQELHAPIARGTPQVEAEYSLALPDMDPIALSVVVPSDTWDSPQVRVEVAKLQVQENNQILMELRYINKIQRDFLIYLADSCRDSTAMVDDAGNDYRCSGTTGIASNQGLSLPAGGQVTASFRFDPPRQMPSRGTRFSFSSTHLLSVPVARGTPQVVARYAVTLLHIELR